jgi:biofilm PGA synthesis N-glycosyltransferase PgaC
MKTKYAVITPVKNEEEFIGREINCVVRQTILPHVWIIINDGSTDRTGEILKTSEDKYDWITVIHISSDEKRKMGGEAVIHVGVNHLEPQSYDFIVKMDADVEFSPNFFENIFQKFHDNPQLGVASGVCYAPKADKLVEEKHPRFHTRGPLKIYRSACFTDIGGLDAHEGWDTIDDIKAHMKGWTTRSYPDLKVIHLRQTQTANGILNGQINVGKAAYYIGYHPLYTILRAVKMSFQSPFLLRGIFMLWGYFKGYIEKKERIGDPAFIQYLRKQQINRLLGRSTIWK